MPVIPAYPRGRGFTTELAGVALPYDLKFLPNLLPDGEEDATHINVGQQVGKPVVAKVWRDGEVAKARMVTDERDGEIAMENIRGNGDVMFQLKGFFITHFIV